MQSVELKISGMSCAHCVAAVDRALKTVPGVSAANVEIGRATVTLDLQQVEIGRVLDAVDDAGYAAEVV